jgi:multiple sugar transport system substrate-binding protein
VASAAGFTQKMDTTLPGVDTFISNLSNVKQARPQITQYPKISTVLGNMVLSVLLNKSTPQAALAAAAKQVNQDLAGS